MALSDARCATTSRLSLPATVNRADTRFDEPDRTWITCWPAASDSGPTTAFGAAAAWTTEPSTVI
jgi:hypothetical protein